MKILKYFWIVVSLISTYIFFIDSGYVSKLDQDVQISKWIVGEWIGNYQFAQGQDAVTIKIDFVDSKHLIYYLSHVPNGDRGNELTTPAKYEFVSENRMLLSGRASEQWQIHRSGNQLIIDIGQSITLTRIPRIGRLLVFLMGVLILRVWWSSGIQGSENNPNKKNEISQVKTVIPLTLGCLLLTTVMCFVLYIYPSHAYFFSLGDPWGEIFIIELSLVLLVSGIKLTRKNHNSLERGNDSRRFLGVTLMGAGVVGTLIGLFLWALFAFTASGYMGSFYLF